MQLIHDPALLARTMTAVRAEGRRVAFVPTMGALHEGHLTLVDEAKRHGDHVVVSVFVNPMQFGPTEDLSKYPRTLTEDTRLCEERGVSTVFAPSAADMYPGGFATRVEVADLTDVLEGAHRPGHFGGVCTVVARLFGLVGPCRAVFGRKDYQQLRVIERMTTDLALPVDVVGIPTSREADGLARSSRNRYLSPQHRGQAVAIADGIRAAAAAFADGVRDDAILTQHAHAPIAAVFDQIDYVTVVGTNTLRVRTDEMEGRVLVVAARIGGTRLIDNHVFGVDSVP